MHSSFLQLLHNFFRPKKLYSCKEVHIWLVPIWGSVLLITNYGLLEYRYFKQFRKNHVIIKQSCESLGISSLHIGGFYLFIHDASDRPIKPEV